MKKLFLLLAASLLLVACTPAATEDTSTPGVSLLPQESSATSVEAGTSSDAQSEDAVSEEEHAKTLFCKFNPFAIKSGK